jgi:hypothetical protein
MPRDAAAAHTLSFEDTIVKEPGKVRAIVGYPNRRARQPCQFTAAAVLLASQMVWPAFAQETWCWKPEVTAPRLTWACVYSHDQCQNPVRLRRSWVCMPAQRY